MFAAYPLKLPVQTLYEKTTSLKHLSLYPYALFACSMIGAITNLLWILTTNRRASQVLYTIEAIDEAVSELIANLRNVSTRQLQVLNRGHFCFICVLSYNNLNHLILITMVLPAQKSITDQRYQFYQS